MLLWVIQIGLLSAITIFLVHNLFNFFKTTLTVPKTLDLVNTSMLKYEQINRTLGNPGAAAAAATVSNQDMKEGLKQFMKSQLEQPPEFADFSGLPTMPY